MYKVILLVEPEKSNSIGPFAIFQKFLRDKGKKKNGVFLRPMGIRVYSQRTKNFRGLKGWVGPKALCQEVFTGPKEPPSRGRKILARGPPREYIILSGDFTPPKKFHPFGRSP